MMPQRSLLSFDKSFAWLQENRKEFSFALGRTELDRCLLMKPFSELVLALSVLERCDFKVRDDLDWAWKEIRNGEHVLDLLLVRPDLTDLIGVVASFASCGYKNSELIKWIGYLRSTRGTRHFEQARWSKIAFEYSLSKLGLRTKHLDLSKTWMASLPEPWVIGDSMAYSVTHNVFYASDFGASLRVFRVQLLEYLRMWLPVWTRCFVEEKHWDMVGELLLAGKCIGCVGSMDAYVEQFFDIQNSDGTFPGPDGAGRTLIDQYVSSERQNFLKNYHTTLVGLMAAAMLSRP
jgi:hypothetical protein